MTLFKSCWASSLYIPFQDKVDAVRRMMSPLLSSIHFSSCLLVANKNRPCYLPNIDAMSDVEDYVEKAD